MTVHYVVAEYPNLELARVGLGVLAKQGLDENQVSMIANTNDPDLGPLMQDNATAHGDDQEESAGEHTAMSAGMGTAIGAGLGFPFAVASMIAPFFVVGPLAAALVGGAGGAAIGGSVAARDKRIETFRERVQQGGILVIVSGEKYLVREAANGLKTTRYTNLDTFEVDEAESESTPTA